MTEAELGAAVGLVARCKRLESQFALCATTPGARICSSLSMRGAGGSGPSTGSIWRACRPAGAAIMAWLIVIAQGGQLMPTIVHEHLSTSLPNGHRGPVCYAFELPG